MTLKDNALTAFDKQIVDEEKAKNEALAQLATRARDQFVRRFDCVPDNVIADEKTIQVEDMLFYYSQIEVDFNIYIRFAMLGTCNKCECVDPEEVQTLADIGRILEYGLQYHDCPEQTEEITAGPEDHLITALIEVIEHYSVTYYPEL
jgi:hypothetical protein